MESLGWKLSAWQDLWMLMNLPCVAEEDATNLAGRDMAVGRLCWRMAWRTFDGLEPENQKLVICGRGISGID